MGCCHLFGLGVAADFTSPRMRGEVEFERSSNSGEGTLRESNCHQLFWRQPLTPTLTARAKLVAPRKNGKRDKGETAALPRYSASALYFFSEAFRSTSAASGSAPAFLAPSAQVLTSGSAAFFQAAVCSGVSL